MRPKGASEVEHKISWYQRLQTRLAFSFAGLAIVSAGIILFVLYMTFQNQLFINLQERLQNIVSIAALNLDGDAHAALINPDQETSEAYFLFKEQLQQIQSTNPDIRSVHTVRLDPQGNIQFVVDAETNPEDIFHIGDLYAGAGPLLVNNIAKINGPVVENEVYTDQSGSWLSGYAPFYTSDGKISGILAIDMAEGKIVEQERQFLKIALSIFGVLIPVMVLIGWLLGRSLASPIKRLSEGVERISSGDLRHRLKVETNDEFSILAQTFNAMTAQLQNMVESLEKRVKERTREVDQRSRYLETAAEVSHAVSSILDVDQLIREVVKVIRERFGLYYVGLFIVDENKEWAVLKAGTGEAGGKMLRRQHKIKLGEGMIGWAISNAKSKVTLDAGQDAIRLSTPELPFTRSEAALPLRSRGKVLGGLTVQSDQENAFDMPTLAALQTMADQIAVALDNARLFSESQEALQRVRRAYGELSREAWEQSLGQRPNLGYRAAADGLKELNEDNFQVTAPEHTREEMSIPITVRGLNLGTLIAHKNADSGDWLPEEINMLNNLTEQLTTAMENARLFADTQRRAERERKISDITSKLRASTSIDVILQTGVRELAEALRIPKGVIRLVSTSENIPVVREAAEDDGGRLNE